MNSLTEGLDTEAPLIDAEDVCRCGAEGSTPRPSSHDARLLDADDGLRCGADGSPPRASAYEGGLNVGGRRGDIAESQLRASACGGLADADETEGVRFTDAADVSAWGCLLARLSGGSP